MNIKIDFLYCFSFFDIRTLTFFQVIMLIYLGETSPFYLLILDVINWFMFGHKLHIYYICEPGCEKNRSSGFPTRSDTNRAVQQQKMARGLKKWIKEVGGL